MEFGSTLDMLQALPPISATVPMDSARVRRVAVLVPCYNEASTIVPVIKGFRASLTKATIYVYDNNSTDGTADLARAAGVVVRTERRQGKGNVIRRMFADIDADCYIMVDGDDTYDPAGTCQRF